MGESLPDTFVVHVPLKHLEDAILYGVEYDEYDQSKQDLDAVIVDRNGIAVQPQNGILQLGRFGLCDLGDTASQDDENGCDQNDVSDHGENETYGILICFISPGLSLEHGEQGFQKPENADGNDEDNNNMNQGIRQWRTVVPDGF